jgi:extracellular factor (EF) 3-hydroxypalmitic acid methyl ester biosynthesis protein
MNEDTFRFLSDNDLQVLLARARRVSGRRGHVFLAEGAQQRNLFLIRKGYVRVERASQGQGIAVARLGPGQVFGEMSFLEETGASASVIAEEDVDVDVVEGAYVQSLLASDPGFSARFFQSLAVGMAHRLRRTTEACSAGLVAEEVSRARFRQDRTGQITERQMPGALVAAVDSFKGALHALDQELRDGQVADAAAQQRVNSACDGLQKVLEEHTRPQALLEIGYDDVLAFRDPAQLAQGVGGYVFRETFPLFMASATMARSYMKPRGYPEDRQILERIYHNEPEGDGRLGPYLDRWFLSRPVCQARRASRRWMTTLIRQRAAARAGPGPVRITSLACGTAEELFELFGGGEVPVFATCIDSDVDALRSTSEAAKDLGCADHITFLQADVLDLALGLGRVELGPQQLIYALGLCDYLTDEQVQRLLDWVHDHLGEGGLAALTNLDVTASDQAFMEHILEWKVFSRTEEQLRELFGRSRFRDGPLTVQREGAGVGVVAGRGT